MIYCVIPRPLAGQLYDRLSEYYRDNPDVEVIVDRRGGPDRRRPGHRPPDDRREVRDRRQRRIPGTFPAIEPPG